MGWPAGGRSGSGGHRHHGADGGGGDRRGAQHGGRRHSRSPPRGGAASLRPGDAHGRPPRSGPADGRDQERVGTADRRHDDSRAAAVQPAPVRAAGGRHGDRGNPRDVGGGGSSQYTERHREEPDRAYGAAGGGGRPDERQPEERPRGHYNASGAAGGAHGSGSARPDSRGRGGLLRSVPLADRDRPGGKGSAGGRSDGRHRSMDHHQDHGSRREVRDDAYEVVTHGGRHEGDRRDDAYGARRDGERRDDAYSGRRDGERGGDGLGSRQDEHRDDGRSGRRDGERHDGGKGGRRDAYGGHQDGERRDDGHGRREERSDDGRGSRRDERREEPARVVTVRTADETRGARQVLDLREPSLSPEAAAGGSRSADAHYAAGDRAGSQRGSRESRNFSPHAGRSRSRSFQRRGRAAPREEALPASAGKGGHRSRTRGVADDEEAQLPASSSAGGSLVPRHVIHNLLVDREKARCGSNFAEADRVRDELRAMGVVIDDKNKTWSSHDGRSGSRPDAYDAKLPREAAPPRKASSKDDELLEEEDLEEEPPERDAVCDDEESAEDGRNTSNKGSKQVEQRAWKANAPWNSAPAAKQAVVRGAKELPWKRNRRGASDDKATPDRKQVSLEVEPSLREPLFKQITRLVQQCRSEYDAQLVYNGRDKVLTITGQRKAVLNAETLVLEELARLKANLRGAEEGAPAGRQQKLEVAVPKAILTPSPRRRSGARRPPSEASRSRASRSRSRDAKSPRSASPPLAAIQAERSPLERPQAEEPQPLVGEERVVVPLPGALARALTAELAARLDKETGVRMALSSAHDARNGDVDGAEIRLLTLVGEAAEIERCIAGIREAIAAGYGGEDHVEVHIDRGLAHVLDAGSFRHLEKAVQGVRLEHREEAIGEYGIVVSVHGPSEAVSRARKSVLSIVDDAVEDQRVRREAAAASAAAPLSPESDDSDSSASASESVDYDGPADAPSAADDGPEGTAVAVPPATEDPVAHNDIKDQAALTAQVPEGNSDASRVEPKARPKQRKPLPAPPSAQLQPTSTAPADAAGESDQPSPAPVAKAEATEMTVSLSTPVAGPVAETEGAEAAASPPSPVVVAKPASSDASADGEGGPAKGDNESDSSDSESPSAKEPESAAAEAVRRFTPTVLAKRSGKMAAEPLSGEPDVEVPEQPSPAAEGGGEGGTASSRGGEAAAASAPAVPPPAAAPPVSAVAAAIAKLEADRMARRRSGWDKAPGEAGATKPEVNKRKLPEEPIAIPYVRQDGSLLPAEVCVSTGVAKVSRTAPRLHITPESAPAAARAARMIAATTPTAKASAHFAAMLAQNPGDREPPETRRQEPYVPPAAYPPASEWPKPEPPAVLLVPAVRAVLTPAAEVSWDSANGKGNAREKGKSKGLLKGKNKVDDNGKGKGKVKAIGKGWGKDKTAHVSNSWEDRGWDTSKSWDDKGWDKSWDTRKDTSSEKWSGKTSTPLRASDVWGSGPAVLATEDEAPSAPAFGTEDEMPTSSIFAPPQAQVSEGLPDGDFDGFGAPKGALAKCASPAGAPASLDIVPAYDAWE